MYRQVWAAFQEDLFVIKKQQENITAFDDSLPSQKDFNQDAGGNQARMIMDRILAQEAECVTAAE